MQKASRITAYILRRVGVAGVVVLALSAIDRDAQFAKIGFSMALVAAVVLPILAIERHLWISSLASDMTAEHVQQLQNPSEEQVRRIHEEATKKASLIWDSASR